MNKIDTKKIDFSPALKNAYNLLSPEEQQLFGLVGLKICLSLGLSSYAERL